MSEQTERFLRFSRISLASMLVVLFLLGGTALSLMLLPREGGYLRIETLAIWLVPVAIATLVAVGVSLRRRHWRRDAPEVQAVENDEWRRISLGLALRWALIASLLAQFPFAWYLHLHHSLDLRATMAMGTLTIILALTVLIAVLLYLDRD